jgi:hypothetical protein
MPTRSSRPSASLRACAFVRPRCSCSGSPTWRAMVCTGFSAVIGSWKIMPMRLPRIWHICFSGRPTSSWPSSLMLPVTWALEGSSPMSDITVIDLPQPDSPTMPSVSPRSSENEMPRTACAGPRCVCRPIWRLLTSRRGIVSCSQRALARRGSSRSRRPSPSRFRPSTASAIAMPGNTASSGCWNMRVCASLSMRPHEGCGGCVPRPR